MVIGCIIQYVICFLYSYVDGLHGMKLQPPVRLGTPNEKQDPAMTVYE